MCLNFSIRHPKTACAPRTALPFGATVLPREPTRTGSTPWVLTDSWVHLCRDHLPVTVACTNRVAEAAHAKTRLHTWRGPRLPRLLLSSVAEGNGAPAPGKAHKSAPAWAPPPHPLSLARACSTLPASACLPLSYPLLCSTLSLSSLVSASLLIRRPLPLYKEKVVFN